MLDAIRKQRAPVTTVIVAALIVSSLIFFFTQGRGMDAFAFNVDWLGKPWSLILYPFAYIGVGGIGTLIFSLFMIAWLFFSGGAVEREQGTARFIGIWLAFTILPALFYWLGLTVLNGGGGSLAGPYMPVVALSLLWTARNPTATFNLWGVLPLSGKVLSWILVAGTFFLYGSQAPLLGIFAILHLGVAFLFATNRLPGLAYSAPKPVDRAEKMRRAREDAFLAEVAERERERREQERLRELFERSGIDDR